MEKEEDSSDGSGSSSSSDSKSEDHYGVIHEDHSKATTHRHKTDDSAYAVFTEPRNGKKHWQKIVLMLTYLWITNIIIANKFNYNKEILETIFVQPLF